VSNENANSEAGLAWREWVGENIGRFLLYARQQIHHSLDAEDIVQEALSELWRRNPGCIPELPHVYTTIRTRSIDLIRSRRRRMQREEFGEGIHGGEESEGVFDGAQGGMILSERHKELEAALKTLSDKESEVVVLNVWSGMSFAEIAEVTECSKSTVASRYRYALEKLRKLMEHF
jgi:RNA polymerase sigma-70 factor (ECF subfamily)